MRIISIPVVLIALLGVTNAASAQQLESIELARNSGDLIASENFCNLEYDQGAIAAFIAKNVRADDMGFASTLELMTEGAKDQLKELSASAKTAHCAQTARVARSYGFIK